MSSICASGVRSPTTYVHLPGPASATVHGRLHTDRHSMGLSAISGSPASRSPSAPNRSAPNGPRSDLQVTQTRRVVAEVGPSAGTFSITPDRHAEGWSSSLLGRPSGGVAEFIGARQVSWLAAYRRRRLPGLGSSPVARKASARRSQSRGRPRIGQGPTVFPFHPLARSRDRARFMFQLRGGLSNAARPEVGVAPSNPSLCGTRRFR